MVHCFLIAHFVLWMLLWLLTDHHLAAIVLACSYRLHNSRAIVSKLRYADAFIFENLWMKHLNSLSQTFTVSQIAGFRDKVFFRFDREFSDTRALQPKVKALLIYIIVGLILSKGRAWRRDISSHCRQARIALPHKHDWLERSRFGSPKFE